MNLIVIVFIKKVKMCYLLGINSLKKEIIKKLLKNFLKLEPHNNLKMMVLVLYYK